MNIKSKKISILIIALCVVLLMGTVKVYAAETLNAEDDPTQNIEEIEVTITPELSEILEEDKRLASEGKDNRDFAEKCFCKDSLAKEIEKLTSQGYRLEWAGAGEGEIGLAFTGDCMVAYSKFQDDVMVRNSRNKYKNAS